MGLKFPSFEKTVGVDRGIEMKDENQADQKILKCGEISII